MTEQQQPGVPVPPMALIAERSCDHTYSDNAKYWAAWGADEQLRLCLEWLRTVAYYEAANDLEDAMRPKPPVPSLKQQALSELDDLVAHAENHKVTLYTDTIRRALEALNDD